MAIPPLAAYRTSPNSMMIDTLEMRATTVNPVSRSASGKEISTYAELLYIVLCRGKGVVEGIPLWLPLYLELREQRVR